MRERHFYIYTTLLWHKTRIYLHRFCAIFGSKTFNSLIRFLMDFFSSKSSSSFFTAKVNTNTLTVNSQYLEETLMNSENIFASTCSQFTRKRTHRRKYRQKKNPEVLHLLLVFSKFWLFSQICQRVSLLEHDNFLI